jgi:hypothetical protein
LTELLLDDGGINSFARGARPADKENVLGINPFLGEMSIK